MAEYRKGKYRILDIWNGTDTYEPIACLRSLTKSQSVSSVETVNNCTDGATYRESGTYSYELSFEGDFAKPDNAHTSVDDIENLLVGMGNVDWRITTTYADATTKIQYGTAHFSELEEAQGGTDEFITFSGSLMGSGKITNTDPNA